VKDILQRRLEAEFDVRPAEFSDAVARVEARRGDIISAQNALRQASDRLKLVINDPSLPITSETLLIASDSVADAPITYALLDAIATAVEQRPGVRRAALAVDARRINLDVAENGLLPDLDLRLEAEWQGLDTDADGAYQEVFEQEFLSTVVGLAFQRALGNRAEEAEFTRARLQVASALTSYQQIARQVIDDVKSSLRDVDTAYRLIEQSRSSRLAAAENLRTLLVEKELTRALTADFLDLEFTRQEALAQAELAEVQALIDYAIAIAELDASTATSLARRGIDVEPPSADELLTEEPLFPLERDRDAMRRLGEPLGERDDRGMRGVTGTGNGT
jgi:outer membrane protein TolC